MTPEKRAYLSALGKARFAALPRDSSCAKCGEPIVESYTFCRSCWAALGDVTRESVLAAAEPGVPWGRQTSPAYHAAVRAACQPEPEAR